MFSPDMFPQSAEPLVDGGDQALGRGVGADRQSLVLGVPEGLLDVVQFRRIGGRYHSSMPSTSRSGWASRIARLYPACPTLCTPEFALAGCR